MYCGFSYEEIAEINNVPVTTVRNWIVRAKIKLRKILSPYFEDSK
jgi:DNA-directed RNA polymerase specialized sigma24 family protein